MYDPATSPKGKGSASAHCTDDIVTHEWRVHAVRGSLERGSQVLVSTEMFNSSGNRIHSDGAMLTLGEIEESPLEWPWAAGDHP